MSTTEETWEMSETYNWFANDRALYMMLRNSSSPKELIERWHDLGMEKLPCNDFIVTDEMLIYVWECEHGTQEENEEEENEEDMHCNQCNVMMIQGVYCHETGCPNKGKAKIDGEWVTNDIDDNEDDQEDEEVRYEQYPSAMAELDAMNDSRLNAFNEWLENRHTDIEEVIESGNLAEELRKFNKGYCGQWSEGIAGMVQEQILSGELHHSRTVADYAKEMQTSSQYWEGSCGHVFKEF